MHHLLTPSHLHRLRAIIFPQDWHFQYPTAEIDKEDPPAWENDQVLIFLLKNCENEGSLKPRPVSVRFIMPQRRPPTQPNLSESRSTNGITDCLSRKQQFPTKFRRNLEISQISEMTSKPKKEQKNRGCVLLSSSSLWNYKWIKEGWHNAGASVCGLLRWLNWKSEENGNGNLTHEHIVGGSLLLGARARLWLESSVTGAVPLQYSVCQILASVSNH